MHSGTGRLEVLSSPLSEHARPTVNNRTLCKRRDTPYMLIDEEDCNVLTFRERLESILNRRYLCFWRQVLV